MLTNEDTSSLLETSLMLLAATADDDRPVVFPRKLDDAVLLFAPDRSRDMVSRGLGRKSLLLLLLALFPLLIISIGS